MPKTNARPRRGRPPKPAGETRDTKLMIRVNSAELRAIQSGADSRHLSTSSWARSVLLDAASKGE